MIAEARAPEGVVGEPRKLIVVVAGAGVDVNSGIKALLLYRLAECGGAVCHGSAVHGAGACIGVGNTLPVAEHGKVKLRVAYEIERIQRLLTGFLGVYRLREEIHADLESRCLCSCKVCGKVIVGVHFAVFTIVPAARSYYRKANAAVIHLLPVDIALILRDIDAEHGLILRPRVHGSAAFVHCKLLGLERVHRNTVLRCYPNIILSVKYLYLPVVGVVLYAHITLIYLDNEHH